MITIKWIWVKFIWEIPNFIKFCQFGWRWSIRRAQFENKLGLDLLPIQESLNGLLAYCSYLIISWQALWKYLITFLTLKCKSAPMPPRSNLRGASYLPKRQKIFLLGTMKPEDPTRAIVIFKMWSWWTFWRGKILCSLSWVRRSSENVLSDWYKLLLLFINCLANIGNTNWLNCDVVQDKCVAFCGSMCF